MWTPENKPRFLSGELALYSGGGVEHLWQVTHGHLWRVCLDPSGKPHWVHRLALSDAEKQLPTAGHDVLPVAEVPGGHGTKLVSVAVFVDELEERYAKGDAWVPQSGGAYELVYPALGSLYVNPASGGFMSRKYPFGTLFEWAWMRPGEMPPEPSAEARAAVAAVLDPIAKLFDDARREGKAVALGYNGGMLIVPLGGRYFVLRGIDEKGVEALLFNPHASALSVSDALDQVAYNPTRCVVDVPEILRAALPKIEPELKRSKREMVDRYIAMLKGGGSISGGPTTDQRWTVRASGGGFEISGYHPTNDGGAELKTDPISEERVREMVGSYSMFGLSGLADE